MATVHFAENEDRIPAGRREVDERAIEEVINMVRPSDEVWLVATHEDPEHLQTVIDFTLTDKTATTTVSRMHDGADHEQFRAEVKAFVEQSWPTTES